MSGEGVESMNALLMLVAMGLVAGSMFAIVIIMLLTDIRNAVRTDRLRSSTRRDWTRKDITN